MTALQQARTFSAVLPQCVVIRFLVTRKQYCSNARLEPSVALCLKLKNLVPSLFSYIDIQAVCEIANERTFFSNLSRHFTVAIALSAKAGTCIICAHLAAFTRSILRAATCSPAFLVPRMDVRVLVSMCCAFCESFICSSWLPVLLVDKLPPTNQFHFVSSVVPNN